MKNKMSDIGLYVSAINIPDYYENTRGYFGVKDVSVFNFFGYPFILKEHWKLFDLTRMKKWF